MNEKLRVCAIARQQQTTLSRELHRSPSYYFLASSANSSSFKKGERRVQEPKYVEHERA